MAVFTKENFCEREDVHLCNIPGSDKRYCMQVCLRLPSNKLKSGVQPGVNGLLCTGYNYTHTNLWAGDSSGQITIWHIPDTGLDFIPAHTTKAHNSSINALKNTSKHVISISDDMYIILFNINSFEKVRSVDVMEWSIYKSNFCLQAN